MTIVTRKGRGVNLVTKDFSVGQREDNNGWAAQPALAGTGISKCGGKQIFGGLNVFSINQSVSKNYENLPAHQWVRLVFSTLLINEWESNGVEVLVDGKRVFTVDRKNSKRGFKSSNFCGTSEAGDEYITNSISFPHSSSSVHVEFRSCGDPAQSEAWGINNVYVWAL